MVELSDAISSRERVLQTAEQLFSERGYAAVTLRDIASALNIKQASLYYHAPGGKEELFVEVTERALERHRAGLNNIMQQADGNLRSQLRAAARWLLSQPVMNYGRMLQSDLRAISEMQAERLRASAYFALIAPLQTVFESNLPSDSAASSRAGHLAGAFLSMIEGIQNLPEHFSAEPRAAMADFLIDTWVDGLQPNGNIHT
ncbi:MAG: TetR/AcrR family transcriptional regulator [Anaerolineae bacterium]